MDPDLDMDSQDYLEALHQATGELQFCVNLCKSRVMMETCFDIVVTGTTATQGGHQEVEVWVDGSEKEEEEEEEVESS